MFDNIKAEKREIDELLERGIEFTVGKRKFTIKQPPIGKLDMLSGLFIDMNFDELKIQENPLQESKWLAKDLSKKCSMVVAIAVLNGRWKLKFLAPVLANYFYWNVTPSKLLNLALVINQMGNYGDFINSIRLMSAVRTTAPSRIEENGRD